MGFLRNWVGILRRMGSQECPNCGPCKESVEHVIFECESYDSQKPNILYYMKQVQGSGSIRSFYSW